MNKVFTAIFDENKKILHDITSLTRTDKLEYLLKIKQEHDNNYHALDSPTISDAQYDELIKMIDFFTNSSTSAAQNNQQDDLFSNLHTKTAYTEVGANPLSTFNKIKHQKDMLSLANALSQQDFVDFVEKTARFLNLNDNTFLQTTCELKIDGLGFSASYYKGVLHKVATRGDGYIGEDVTENVLNVTAFTASGNVAGNVFPKKLNGDKVPDFIEIRGEIFMTKTDFDALNEHQKQQNAKIFANPRNAAAGSLRQIDSSVSHGRKLKYLAYTIGGCSDDFTYISQQDLMAKLTQFGFATNAITVCETMNDVFKYHEQMQQNRAFIDFDVDGIVCKINDKITQDRLGYLARSPRWAIAFKFSSIKCSTKLLDVEYSVGRTGVITPVAILQPVNIGGVVVKKCTLHNFDEIKRLGIKIGYTVVLERAGDVIPKIIEVEKSFDEIKNIDNYSKIVKPRHCPCCQNSLTQEDDGVLLKCENRFGCKQQIIATMEHFCSKDAFDIVGLASKQINLFYELNWIKNVSDIFTLHTKSQELIAMDGFGEKSVHNLLASIESRRNISMQRLIYSLGFYGVGEVASKQLAEYFKNPQNLMTQNWHEITQSLLNIDGIGEKTVQDFILTLKNENFRQILTNLLTNIRVIAWQGGQKSSLKYHGQKIIFTGTLTSMSRSEAKYKAEQLGFVVASSISKAVDIVVVGQDAGSKLKKAAELGLKIINEEDWIAIGIEK